MCWWNCLVTMHSLFMSLNHLQMHFVCSIRRFCLVDSSYSKYTQNNQGSSSSSSYGSWIYNYLCNQCLSPLKLWVRTPFMSRCIRYNTIWQSLSVTCDRSVVSLGTLVFSTNKTDHHDITEILLKVALNTINQTKQWYGLIFTVPTIK